MAIVPIDGYCSLLRKVPRVQDMHLAKVQRHRRASEIADRNRVARFVNAVLDCAELFDLTLHAGRVSGGFFGVYSRIVPMRHKATRAILRHGVPPCLSINRHAEDSGSLEHLDARTLDVLLFATGLTPTLNESTSIDS